MRVFKKLLGLFTILVMAIGLMAVPNVSAKADEAKGEVHFANDFALDVDDLGNVRYIYAYASTDATATVKTYTSQDIESLQWWYGYVLERNAAGNYVVTIADTDIYDGVNAAETATLGEGKIAIVFHSNTVKKHQASIDFFKLLKEGDEVALDSTWEDLAAASGILTKPASFTIVPMGKVHLANGYAWDADKRGYERNVFVYASVDKTATSKTFTGQDVGFMKWWYGYVLERNTTGNYVVTVADADTSDGVNAAEKATLGEGKLLIIFHGDAVKNHPISVAFFKSLKVGYVVTSDCAWEDLAAARGPLATPVIFSIVSRAVETSNDGSDITDDDTADDNITSNDTIDDDTIDDDTIDDGTTSDDAADDTADDDAAEDDITGDDTTTDNTIDDDAADDTTDADIADDDTTDKEIEDTSKNLVVAMVVLFICLTLVTVVIVVRKRV